MKNCKFKYVPGNDQFTCDRCGYYWDRGDTEPTCRTDAEIAQIESDELRVRVETLQQQSMSALQDLRNSSTDDVCVKSAVATLEGMTVVDDGSPQIEMFGDRRELWFSCAESLPERGIVVRIQTLNGVTYEGFMSQCDGRWLTAKGFNVVTSPDDAIAWWRPSVSGDCDD